MSKFYEHITESMWGDIHRRNSGEVVRKEDEIPESIKEALAAYIDIFVHGIDGADVYTVGSLPDFKAFIKDFANKPRISNIDFDMDELLDYVEDHRDYILDIIHKTMEAYDKQIDDLYDQIRSDLEKGEVSESMWGDIHRRNSGEVIRKEDMIIESLEDLREYIQKKVDDTEEGGIVNLRNLDLSNLWSLDRAFSGLSHLYRLKGIDVTGWKTSTIRHMEYVFQWAESISSIIGLETWDVSSVYTMKGMFYNCKKVLELNVGGWDVSGVNDMSEMFYGCESLKKLDIGEWQIKYEYGILMESMFKGCKSLTELNIGKWNISKVEKMNNMFYGCESLTNIPIENWKLTSKTRSIAYMFAHCKSLTKVPIEHWNVKSIKDMSGLFSYCTGLTEIDLSNWNLGVVPKDMHSMFSYCENLTEMHIENWNVGHVSNMSYMFSHCKSLTKLHLEKWDVSNVSAMSSMFDYCENLKVLNIENWKVNNVEKIQRMFQDSKNLPELDLSKWEFKRLKETDHVFRDSSMKDYFIRYWDKAWRIFKPKVTSDEMGEDDFLLLKQFMEQYDSIISQKYHYVGWTNNCKGCIDYLETNKKNHSGSINNGPVEDRTYNKIIKFVKDNWGDCKNIQEFMDKYLSHLKDKEINESMWGDIHRRNSGEVIRKEDKMNEDDLKGLIVILHMFGRAVKYSMSKYKRFAATPNDEIYYNTPEDFEKYVDGLKSQNFIGVDFDKIKKYVVKNWEKDPEIQNNISEIIDESMWGDIHRRNSGEAVRKEDEINLDDFEFIILGGTASRALCDAYSPDDDSKEGLIKYIEERKKEHRYTYNGKKLEDYTYDRMIKYVDLHWGDCKNIKQFIDECIPNNLDESMWGDIHRRNSGEAVRKEDDVNLLNDMAFTEYLKDTYTVNDPITSLEIYIDGAGEITLPVFEYDMGTRSVEFMYYTPKEKKVLIGDWFCHWDYKLMDKIKKTYKTSEIAVMYSKYIQISPKKGEINNRFFLEVLDFILENANRFYHRLLVKNIKESMWGDIHRRNSGESVRKEDDVDLLGIDGFYDYLQKHYECTASFFDNSDNGVILVPLYIMDNHRGYSHLYISYDEGLNNISDIRFRSLNYISKVLKEHNLKLAKSGPFVMVSPEDGGQIDNKFCLKVIDLIISTANRPILKKVEGLDECDGVPGGLTPGDVAGMGAITFPGPDGTPGSGDLPSPTGKVYQQVAPFGIFVNSLYGKRKKKRKKKFRKEDEPCVHSPNAKVYDYVDDFRDYVDRTYNIIDRR